MLSMHSEISRQIGWATSVLVNATSMQVWDNDKLTLNTKSKMTVYRACVLSALLYICQQVMDSVLEAGKEAQHFPHAQPETDTGHQIVGPHFLTNSEVLRCAATPSIYTLLRQHHHHWLGHVHRMQDSRIHKDLLYGKLATGKRTEGCPQLRFKDVKLKETWTDEGPWHGCRWMGRPCPGLFLLETGTILQPAQRGRAATACIRWTKSEMQKQPTSSTCQHLI